MNSNLAVKENLNVCGVTVPSISGGFGQGKKAMLAKHISEIHEKETKKVNELINRNRDKFKDSVDVIDLKGDKFEVFLRDHEILSQNAINRATNIYLLSERGYAKLIKLFNDDKSWELYDQMLDEYFDMREELSNIKPINNAPMSQAEMLVMYAQQFVEQEKRLVAVESQSNQVHNKVTKIHTYLTETPDSKKIQREINNYARKHNLNQNDVRMMIYNKIEDKFGIDIMTRVSNGRKRINQERVNSGKEAYKESTLKNKLNGMHIVAEEGLMKDMLEILAGIDE